MIITVNIKNENLQAILLAILKTIEYTGWFVFYDLWVKFLQVLSCD